MPKILKVSEITKKETPTEEASSIGFKVPKLNNGDKLIAILSIKGKTIEPSGSCEHLIRSVVERE